MGTNKAKNDAKEKFVVEELNHILSSIPCGVLQYRKSDNKLIRANDTALEILGYNTLEELKNDRENGVVRNVLPEDRKKMTELIDSLKKPGDTKTIEYRVKPGDSDEIRYCLGTLQMYDDVYGDRIILRSMVDITSQKKMLAEIRKERQQYREALVSGSEYSYRFDVTEGIVHSDFNYSTRGTLENNLGIKAPIRFDDLIQRWAEVMKPLFLTPDEQNPMTAKEVEDCYKKGMKHVVSEYFNVTEGKYFRRSLLLSEDEETGHIWAIAIVNDISNLIREETRKRNELSIINRDLTDQINMSKAFSSIYFATWSVDLRTKHMTSITVPDWASEVMKATDGDYNATFELLISSYIKEESVKEVKKFICIDDLADRLKNESILACEIEGVHYGWTTACFIPYMYDEDKNVTNAIFAVREISNEKRIELETKQALEEAYEAANRANAAKTDFLSSVSHDIRTPMNGIIGMTALAGAHLDDRERVKDCLSKISISSKHLLGLINEVLDMNKIESGKLDLNKEEFNIHELIDTLMVISKPQTEEKEHDLSVSVKNIEHENVIGDNLRLQQVLINLLSNSIKYTPKGGTITLDVCEKSTNSPKIGCYEFVITDNGIGMSEEFQEHLFEPFSRANDSRVEKAQGSGLGMLISRNIVRMMNGDIKVESRLSKGTKITVTVFLELAASEKSDASSKDSSRQGLSLVDDLSDLNFKGKTALLTEDNELNAEIAGEILSMTGLKVEYAVNGKEAVDMLAEHPEGYYDIVFMDIQMPVMNGYEAATAIRSLPGSYPKSVPIIAMTANAFADDVLASKNAGMNEHVAKPINITQLSKVLTDWLS